MTERARVYGGSLYDLAAEDNLTGAGKSISLVAGLTDTILEQMTEIRKLFRENPDYLKLLSEPAIKKDERLDLIEKAFGASVERYLVSFLKLLCERNLLGEYEGCCEAYRKRYNADHNIADAVVTSAVALTGEQLEALRVKLSSVSGKKVVLEQKIDRSVLAGIKVELEGKQLDGTVAGRLSGMSRQLNETIM